MIYRQEVGKMNVHRNVDKNLERKHVEPCRYFSLSRRLTSTYRPTKR